MKTLIVSLFTMLSVLLPKAVEESPVFADGVQQKCRIGVAPVTVCADKTFSDLVPVWAEFMNGTPVGVKTVRSGHKAAVTLRQVSGLEEEEYVLRMSAKNITVEASTPKGAWWGLQSVTQMIVAALPGKSADAVILPAYIIKDKPAFSYRGAHLDCCRHFFTVQEVKRFIDMMCLHKLNTFHWHLTDDQGWRIEIKKYPLLTESGAIRKETIVGHSHDRPQKFDGVPYGKGMFYTQEQCREVVAYAAARQITVIPEIEMPGHMVAALSAYPYLGCTGGPYEVWTKWGISKDVLCLGKESSYGFVEDILTEVCDVFPSHYIHIGGDEAPVDRRRSCQACQQKMKELGYTEEKQLQGHLITRVEEFMKTKGREIIGWNEILDTGISKDAIIMSWQGTGTSGVLAAQRGNRVIMTPGKFLYFDYYQTENPSQEPLAIGGCLPLKKVYSFDPYAGLNEQQRSCIVGIQANTWTEYMASFDHVQHMNLPRMSALSELSWSAEKDDYGAFFDRLKANMLPLYDFFGYIYAKYEFK